ncbi:MAG: ACP S-malonyltransferase [Phycisphaerae bacterium]|nr:ACP S-malonyltransferase [Phycisphaerae bacterium]
MTTRAAIFPGQGAQLVGMGQDVAGQYPVAAETFAEADQVVGFALSKLCFEGPAERLNATDIQQPAIFTTSVALYRAGLAAGRYPADAFVALGGLSLGEYTALHLAGAMSFADALRLVMRRGQLMQQAAEQQAGGMVSLIGGDEAKVLALCEAVAAQGRVQPANYNCPGQIVISGDKGACDVAAQRAEEFGLRAVPLPVAGAFHSKLMRSAAEGLRPALEGCAFQTPKARVIANVNAEYHRDPAAIREALYQQVVSPVRWQACVERLIADGCGEFWEIGPNRHLTGMMRKINRKVPTTNVSTAADLSAQ